MGLIQPLPWEVESRGQTRLCGASVLSVRGNRQQVVSNGQMACTHWTWPSRREPPCLTSSGTRTFFTQQRTVTLPVLR